MRIERAGPTMVEGKHQRAIFLVCLPTLGMVPIEFLIAFSRMALPLNALAQTLVVSKEEVGVARNYAAEFAMNMKPRPKYLLFLGDDMIPPYDAVVRLWEECEKNDWAVLSALYFIKGEPPVPLVWSRDVIGPLQAGVHYKIGDVVPVDTTGMDCCLIRPEVFDKIDKPYFKTGPTVKTDGTVFLHTEDVYFLDKVKKANLKIGVHTGIRCSHFDVKSGWVY